MPRNPLQDYDWGLPEGQGRLDPDMLRIDHFLPQIEAHFERAGLLDGDLFWPVVPTRSLPWLEAIAGASIHYTNEGGNVNIFAEGSNLEWDRLPAAGRLGDNPWFFKLIKFVEELAELSAGRFPLAGSHTRGPWDIVSALAGMSCVYLELYSHPEELIQLAQRCADLWIQVTQKLAAATPAWEGGYVGPMGIWAHSFTPMPQNDMSISVSPSMYKEMLLPVDLRTTETWEHPMFHTHSGGAHQLEKILEVLPRGAALNVVIDEKGKPLEELIPILRSIQEQQVPLHLFSPDAKQVEALISALSPRGLAISYID